jgi:phage protein U
MLYLLGALRIEVAPFNVHETDERSESDFVVKPVVGTAAPLEYVGPGTSEITLNGRLFPEALGGRSGLAVLAAMQASGQPQYLIRGDGRPYGWHAILGVDVRSEFLDARGVGKKLDVTIRLRKAPGPSLGAFAGIMEALVR